MLTHTQILHNIVASFKESVFCREHNTRLFIRGNSYDFTTSEFTCNHSDKNKRCREFRLLFNLGVDPQPIVQVGNELFKEAPFRKGDA